MTSTTLLRGLDFAPTASIDKVALNNKVVMMRAVVRRAKLHTINALVKKMQKLRNKKGTESQLAQNKSKADRLFEEVKIIKLLKPDYVSKYALGSTEKFEELLKKPSTTLDIRALARLAQQKFIQEVVDKFRAEHEDWKDLAAYLVTKQTSREFKNKKTKEKMKKVAANMQASETLVQKFLGEKLKGSIADVDDNDGVDNHVSSDDDDSGEGTSSGKIVVNDSDNAQENVNYDRAKRSERIQDKMQTSKILMPLKQIKGQKSKGLETEDLNESFEENEGSGDSGEDDDNIKLSIESDNESTGNNEEVDSDDGSESEMENGYDDLNEDEDDSGHISEDSLAELDKEAVQQKSILSGKKSKNSNSKSISPKKASPYKNLPVHKDVDSEESLNMKKKKKALTEKVEGEMIIKKLNLQKNINEDDIPTILLGSNDERPVKRRKIKMDAFFDTGEENGNETGDNNDNEPNKDDFGSAKGRHDDGNLDNNIKPTISAFNTCFVGSLRSADMMSCKDIQYRSNEEWKRIRHEAREQTMGRGRGSSFARGRGHGPAFRGRGSSRPYIGQRGRGRGRGFDSSEDGRHSSRGRHDFGNSKDSAKKESGLHPSWEASKKRKQEQKMVFQAFTGKKMKFSD